MKRLMIAGFALALLIPACAFAQSAFNGTWKLDPTTVRMSGGKPMVISLKNGVFSRSATPPVEVKADGRFHAVKGHKSFDAAAVTVVNDHTFSATQQKDGKVVAVVTFTVAPDGKTGTASITEHRDSGPATFKEVMKRVGKGEPGANAVNGSWAFDRIASSTGPVSAPTYKVVGDTVTVTGIRDRVHYTAKIGGKPVPNMVDGKANGTVAVKMLGKRTLRETYAKDGKVTSTTTLTVLRGGKSMKMVDHDMKTGATTTMIHHKE